jgi:hypothetical protein|tara:strand:+ start:177 stop:374 length:198 start_codon:yes stop_codon:yes gene_type:complete
MSDMRLTEPVEEALNEAQRDLREALAFAARSEKPYISKHIADILLKIDTLLDISKVIKQVEESSS